MPRVVPRRYADGSWKSGRRPRPGSKGLRQGDRLGRHGGRGAAAAGRLMGSRRSYISTVVSSEDGTAWVPVPFDPDEVWGVKRRHLITGEG